MLRVITGLLLLLMLTASADARTKVRVTKEVQRPIAEHPYAVELALSAMLCHFAVGATAPGQPLPPCATPHASPYNAYAWQPRQKLRKHRRA